MASESKSNIDVKIFVVAKIERREKYGITYVFCENEVRLMTFPPKFFDVLKTNKHYLCRGVAIGETVRLYESSRVSFIPTMCILQQKVVHVYVQYCAKSEDNFQNFPFISYEFTFFQTIIMK